MNLFINRYDIEFIGLLNEISNRLVYFKKEDHLKIKSWINILSGPYQTEKEKQNRNLYAIKLLNQMVNGKLKIPFINYCKTNKLKQLLPIDIKGELTQKFLTEINFKELVNYAYQKQKKFLELHPELNKNNNNKNNNFLRYTDKSNSIFIVDKEDLNNKFDESFSFTNISNIDKNRVTQKNENFKPESDLNDKISEELNMDYNDEDNYRLFQLIEELEYQINENDKIIEYQNNEINKLINILVDLINKPDLNENKE